MNIKWLHYACVLLQTVNCCHPDFQFLDFLKWNQNKKIEILCNYCETKNPVCLSNVSKKSLAILRGIRPYSSVNSSFFVFSGPPEYGEDSCGYSLPSCSLQPALQCAYPKRQWWSDRQHHQVQKPVTDSSEHNTSTQLSDLILTVTLHRIHQGPGPHLS